MLLEAAQDFFQLGLNRFKMFATLRSASCSPKQNKTVRSLRENLIYFSTNSVPVSWKRLRRSLWPTSTCVAPTNKHGSRNFAGMSPLYRDGCNFVHRNKTLFAINQITWYAKGKGGKTMRTTSIGSWEFTYCIYQTFCFGVEAGIHFQLPATIFFFLFMLILFLHADQTLHRAHPTTTLITTKYNRKYGL